MTQFASEDKWFSGVNKKHVSCTELVTWSMASKTSTVKEIWRITCRKHKKIHNDLRIRDRREGIEKFKQTKCSMDANKDHTWEDRHENTWVKCKSKQGEIGTCAALTEQYVSWQGDYGTQFTPLLVEWTFIKRTIRNCQCYSCIRNGNWRAPEPNLSFS